MSFTRSRDQNRHAEPQTQCYEKHNSGVPDRKQFPNKQSETDESKTAYGGAPSIQRRCLSAPRSVRNSSLPLLFPFVFFNERGAGGKDSRECEEKAAEYGTEPFGQQACNYRDGAAEQEPNAISIPPSSCESRQVKGYSHRSLAQKDCPNSDGASQPEGERRNRGQRRMDSIPHHQQAAQYSVRKESDCAHNHRPGLYRSIELTLCRDCQSESGERDGRRSREQAGKTFGSKDVAESGEQCDDEAAKGETENELRD
jgi:hypothetical protein